MEKIAEKIVEAVGDMIHISENEKKIITAHLVDEIPAILLDVPFKLYWNVWSNEHKAWWKSNHRGYDPDKNNAGVYTTGEAMKIVRGANEFQLADDVPNEAMVPLHSHKHKDDE